MIPMHGEAWLGILGVEEWTNFESLPDLIAVGSGWRRQRPGLWVNRVDLGWLFWLMQCLMYVS